MKAPRAHTTSLVSESSATDEVSVLSIAKVLGSVMIDMRNKFGGNWPGRLKITIKVEALE